MYQLYIANKNYSSWSLRPWLLMRELGIAFEEHLLPFGDTARWSQYRRTSPAGKVPCVVDGERTVWESLAIVEYLAERHTVVWPEDATARAWSRSASAEMHAGFGELRTRCSMSCGVRVRLNEMPPALERDIARLSELWNEGINRFGGPYLAGKAFTAVDAFFAPVAFRVQTYNLALDAVGAAYAARLRSLTGMREWYEAALSETFRDEPHDAELLQFGTVLQDLRAPPDTAPVPAPREKA
jgi:glutathione S-transferase